MDFIAKLQEKPINIRKRILILSTSSITLLIVAIWFILSHVGIINKGDGDSSTNIASPLSPISSIYTTIKNTVGAEKQVLQKTLKF